jgi:hypothetical protein
MMCGFNFVLVFANHEDQYAKEMPISPNFGRGGEKQAPLSPTLFQSWPFYHFDGGLRKDFFVQVLFLKSFMWSQVGCTLTIAF